MGDTTFAAAFRIQNAAMYCASHVKHVPEGVVGDHETRYSPLKYVPQGQKAQMAKNMATVTLKGHRDRSGVSLRRSLCNVSQ